MVPLLFVAWAVRAAGFLACAAGLGRFPPREVTGGGALPRPAGPPYSSRRARSRSSSRMSSTDSSTKTIPTTFWGVICSWSTRALSTMPTRGLM